MVKLQADIFKGLLKIFLIMELSSSTIPTSLVIKNWH